jgi:hypothetical protein
MTVTEYRTLFLGKDLIVGDNYYRFNNKGQYLLAKGDESVVGEYDFIQVGDKVYFVTNPPIYPEIGKKVEVSLYLGSQKVLFQNK